MRVEEILTDKILHDYTKTNPAEPGGIQALFPTLKVPDIEVDFIKGANNKEVMADFYAFDTPTEIGQRNSYESGSLDLFLIKHKMKLDERELMHLNHPRSDAEVQYIINNIYNDVDSILQRIENKITYMCYEVLQTGKVTIEGNGLNTSIDFGVPSNHIGDLNWKDPKHDVLADIFDISNMLFEETGFRPQHIMVSNQTIFNLLKNETIRLALLGTEAAKMITLPELNAELTRVGLPTFFVDEQTYAVETVKRKRRTLEQKRYFDVDKIVFLPGGPMGNIFRGPVPEAELKAFSPAMTHNAGDVFLTYYQDVDPVAQYIKGSATAMVSFPYADQIYIGTNKE